MADEEKYEHGSMDISEREQMFAGFISWSVWACVAIVLALIFLALTQT